MKKFLVWVLLLALVVGAFAGCKSDETVEPTQAPTSDVSGNADGVNSAMEYLKMMYPVEDAPTRTLLSYERMNVVRINNVPYDVVWTTDLSEDLIQIVDNGNGTVTIKIVSNPEEDMPYKLTATITDENGNAATYTWDMVLAKAIDMAAIVDEAYELADGETLPYEATLTGKVISIDTVWSDDYQNITVTMAVEGKEDKPIKCYRLKGDGAKDLQVGNIITVTGTIKNYGGTIEFDAGCMLERVEKGDAVEVPTDPGEILKAAYALAENAALPYPAVLTGKVIEIDTPYDPNYGNICVVIEVEGYSQYPILCYRLKGVGVDQIAIEDIITVNGIIKNYKGTIEYDAGCQLVERISGGNIAEKPSSDPSKIIPDAMALAPGESLPYRATLTGTVYSIDTPYSAQYNNITVTMVVQGYKFQCYRMVGDGIDQIQETDTITVSGIIKNYNGKIEFDTKCTLDSWSKGPRNVNYGPVAEDVAYALYIDQKTAGKTIYFNGEISGTRLQTSDKGSKAIEVYGERISGKGMRFFYMDGETKTYIEIEEYLNDEGKARGRAIVTTSPSCYWTYLSDMGVYVVSLPTAGKYFLGTYSSYETITASWSGYLESSSNPQYIAKFMKFSDVPVEEPSDMIAQGTPVDAPVAGTAYKFGYYQNQLDGKPFLAFNGTKPGYYFATSDVMAEMVDVYLEEAEDGYHIYFMKDNTKTYLDVVVRETDNTKVDVAMQTSGTHTVYQLNLEHKYVYTSLAGSEWYLGTFNTNNSISASKTSFISDTSLIGVSQFCAWFNNVEEVPAPEEEEPEVPSEPTPGDPSTQVGLKNGDQVVIFAPAYNKALSADKVTATSYYNKGVDITVSGNTVTGYGAAETWTVIVNADGTYSFANGGKNIGLAAEYSSMNLGAINDTWNVISLGDGLYNIKNVGRGNFIEWFAEKDNWSSYNSNYAATDDQFQLSFYVIGKGILEDAPETSEPTPSEPSEQVGLENGDQVVIFAPAYNKALSADKVTATSYYNKGVDITVSGDTVTGYGAAETWTVIVNADGTYSFANGGKNIGLTAEYSSMNLGAINDTWNLISLGDGLYNIKNVGRGNFIEWFAEKDNWSSYNSNYAATDDQFQLSFYVIGKGILEDAPETSEPAPSEPTPSEPSEQVGLENGDQVVIFAPAYNKALSADKVTATSYYNKGVDITVSGNTVTGYGAAETWTVIVNADGTYSFANGGKNIGLAAEFSSMNLGAINDTWNLISLGDGLYNIKNVGRGNFMEWFAEKDNWSSYNSNYAATDDQFQLSFYVIGKGILEDAPETSEPAPSEPTPSEPSEQVGLENGDQVVIFAPAYNKALSADKVTATSYYNKGVDITVSGNTVTGYGAAETWTVIVNADGTYSFANGGKNIGLAADYASMNLGAINDTWNLISLGDGLYNIKNVGRGNFMEWFAEKDNWSSYNSNYAATDDQFQLSFYVIGKGILEDAPETSEPAPSEPTPSEPSEQVGLENGDQVVIFAPAYNKALSADKVTATSYYNKGVDITVSGNTVTGYGAAETWTVIVNADGTYSFANGGKNIGLAADYASMNLGAINDTWNLISLGDGLYNIKNVGRGNFMEWFAEKDNWSSYNSNYAATDDQFQLSFYVIGKGILEDAPETSEPAPSQPGESEPAGSTTVTYNLSNYPTYAQYVDVTVELDENLSVSVYDGQFIAQIRLYQDMNHDSTAVFTSQKPISNIVINAGHRDSDLLVYASNDGQTWQLVDTVTVSASAYADLSVEIDNYKYIKLDSEDKQVRVASVTVTFEG